MALQRKDNVSMHDALDQMNEQKVLLVKDFLDSKSHLLRYPKVFLTFSLEAKDLCTKTVLCRPSATCPHFQFGADVWMLDTRTGEMELQWTLPGMHAKSTKKDLQRFLDEEHAYYDPLCVDSVRKLLSGEIPAYTKFYNENFPFTAIAKQIHAETHGQEIG
jgi:hypothetical protein